ncbi:MAG: hypothetical protein AAF296_08595, partial [Pseudomonadota bacterium]
IALAVTTFAFDVFGFRVSRDEAAETSELINERTRRAEWVGEVDRRQLYSFDFEGIHLIKVRRDAKPSWRLSRRYPDVELTEVSICTAEWRDRDVILSAARVELEDGGIFSLLLNPLDMHHVMEAEFELNVDLDGVEKIWEVKDRDCSRTIDYDGAECGVLNDYLLDGEFRRLGFADTITIEFLSDGDWGFEEAASDRSYAREFKSYVDQWAGEHGEERSYARVVRQPGFPELIEEIDPRATREVSKRSEVKAGQDKQGTGSNDDPPTIVVTGSRFRDDGVTPEMPDLWLATKRDVPRISLQPRLFQHASMALDLCDEIPVDEFQRQQILIQ